MPSEAYIVMSPFWGAGSNKEQLTVLLDRHIQVGG